MTDGSLALTLLRAVISLALVLALLIFSMRALARRGGLAPRVRDHRIDLDVLARRQLAKGSSVHVVRVADRVLVLGVTDHHISVLTHLSPSDIAADEEPDGAAPTAPTTTDLVDVLRRQGGAARLAAGLGGSRRAGRHRGGSKV